MSRVNKNQLINSKTVINNFLLNAFSVVFGLFISLNTYGQCSFTVNNVAAVDPSCPGACDGSITLTITQGSSAISYQWYDGGGTPIGTNSNTISGLCAGNYSVDITESTGGTTQIFFDDFETGAPGWNLNVVMAAEGADPNFWQITDDEGGVAVGGCGVAGNGNNTLHVTSVFFPAGGAAYDAGGLCGFLYCPEAHRQCETPIISTVGYTGLTLMFDYIANGDIPFDQATVWYDDGGGWTQLGGALSAPTCISGQGLWTAYSAALPASCENIPNLRVAIRWDNNDDGVGTDPSVAINDIKIVSASGGGCTQTESMTLTDPAGDDPSFTLTDFCAGDPNNATNIATPGGTFAYNPNPSDGSSVNPSTGEITNGIPGTTYTVEYTTNGACPVSATNTVTVNGFTYSAVITDENCGAGDGAIDLSVNGGTGPFDYSIDAGSTSQGNGSFSNLSAGNYSVIITDNGTGCTASGTEIVGNIGGPNIDAINPVDPTCAGTCDGSITVTVSGGTTPYSYQWYDGGGAPIGTNADNIGNLCAGNYSVEITDASGGGSGTVLNSNSDFEAGPGGGCNCPTGYTCNNDAGQVFDGSNPVYTVGNQGCITSATNYTNSLGANSGSGYIYFYAGADNISSGSYIFAGGETVEICVWYAGPQGAGASGQNTGNSYFTLGIDGASVSPQVLVPTNTGWTQYCFTVVMTAGSHTFQILSGGAAQYSIWFDDWTITDISGGGGGTGCPVTATATITDPPAEDPSFTVTDFCAGASNSATNIASPGGTFAYNPNPGDGSSVDPVTGEISNGVPGTTYTVEYTTGGSCPAIMTNNVTVNGFTYSSTITDENCGAGDGSIDLTVNGGTGPFDYSVDGGTTTQGSGLFSNLSAGNYTILIVDLTTGCTGSGNEIVNNIGGPTISNIVGTDPTCLGVCDGTITATVTGGVIPYTYQWFDAANNPIGTNSNTITGLCDGQYTLAVTDANANCISTATVTLNPGPNCCDVVIDTVYTLNPNCGISNGEIEVQATGGTGTYQFNINGGAFSANSLYTGLSAGNFELIAIDGNGCSDTMYVDLTDAQGPTIISVDITDPTCFGYLDGEIQVNTSGGTGTLTYDLVLGSSIDNNATGLFAGIGANNYTVVVTDQNGCQVTAPANMSEPDTLEVTTVTTDEICFEECNGQLVWSAQGGTMPYNFVFDGSQVSNTTIGSLCPGDYAYVLTDDNGCQVADQITIAAAQELIIDSVAVVNNGCDDNCVGSISVYSANAVSYEMGGNIGTSGIYTDLCSDVYGITVSDANGCTVQVVEVVEAGTPVEAGFFYSPQDVTFLEPEIHVGELSTGETQYFWEITGEDGYYETYTTSSFDHVLPSDTGTYLLCLIASNESGCADTACQLIVVDEGIMIWVPNSFTPDGDEFNQSWKFTITGIDDYDFSLTLYNRWGEVIWQTQDPDYPWDGTFNGKTVQSGTYTWVMYIKDPESEYRETRHGHVNVIR